MIHVVAMQRMSAWQPRKMSFDKIFHPGGFASPFCGLHAPWTNPGYSGVVQCDCPALRYIVKWYLEQIRGSPYRHLATCKVTELAIPQRECRQDGNTGFHGGFTVGNIKGMKWRSMQWALKSLSCLSSFKPFDLRVIYIYIAYLSYMQTILCK